MLPFTFQTSIELRILNLLSKEIQKTIIKGHTLTTWIPTPKYHNSVLDFIQHRKNTWSCIKKFRWESAERQSDITILTVSVSVTQTDLTATE